MTKVRYRKMEVDTTTPILDELGLVADTTVRFRRREEDRWITGTLKGDSKDGSLSIVDKHGKWCSIMPEKVMIAKKGPRGGRLWLSAVEYSTN